VADGHVADAMLSTRRTATRPFSARNIRRKFVATMSVEAASSSRARALLGTQRLPHVRAMAGCPIRRARRAADGEPGDGGGVAFSFLPRVGRADKPPGWNRGREPRRPSISSACRSTASTIISAWSPHELDPHRLAAQSQAVRVVVMIAATVGIEAQRQALDQAAMEELARRLSGKDESDE
jgi:hypothetical protein